MTGGPFAALGLPASRELSDDDVRAAWRRVAAATHPDRDDGGDPAAFAAAAAAYTQLRTRYGRGEAYADLAAGHGTRVPRVVAALAAQVRRRGPGMVAALAARARVGRPRGPRMVAGLAARARAGRPALLAARAVLAAGVIAAAFAVTGTSPAAAGLAAGALTWLVLAARHDLAPPAAGPGNAGGGHGDQRAAGPRRDGDVTEGP